MHITEGEDFRFQAGLQGVLDAVVKPASCSPEPSAGLARQLWAAPRVLREHSTPLLRAGVQGPSWRHTLLRREVWACDKALPSPGVGAGGKIQVQKWPKGREAPEGDTGRSLEDDQTVCPLHTRWTAFPDPPEAWWDEGHPQCHPVSEQEARSLLMPPGCQGPVPGRVSVSLTSPQDHRPQGGLWETMQDDRSAP